MTRAAAKLLPYVVGFVAQGHGAARNGGQQGRHQRTLDVGALPSGVYFLRLRAGGEVRTQKLTVAR